MPSEVARVVDLWKESVGEKIAQSLASPVQYDNLFPGFQDSLKAEQFLEKQTSRPMPAAAAVTMQVI